MKKVQVNEITREYEPCSDTSICSQELEASHSQPIDLGEYEQLSLLKSTPMHSEFSDTTSQISPSTQTSETTIQNQENSTSSQWDFPVQARVTQELNKDYHIQPHHSGEKDLDVSLKPNPSSVLWNNLKDLSDGDLELFLPASIWQDTLLRLKQSRRESLEHHIKDSEYLSFPTLTSNECSTSRPAGQTKCEKWFRDKGLIPSGYQLGTKAMALVMGFPSNWFEVLSQKNSKNLNIQSHLIPQEESGQGISQVEQLHQDRQRSLLEEFSTCPSCKAQTIKLTEGCGICGWLGCDFLLGDKSAKTEIPVTDIPCLIKQPDRPELKGVIRKDLGDRFDVYIPHLNKSIAYLKLFVYPDFSKSVGQLDKNPRKKLHPSTNNPRKTRRKKGQGNGSIYYRTVTKNGKEYPEAYYHYVENGKKRTKYIPKKLLDKVQEAESLKLPVSDILVFLGGDKKNPRKSSSTLSTVIDEKLNDSCVEQVLKDTAPHMLETNEKNPRKTIPPSTNRRKQGEGTGYIECKLVKRSGKNYKEYWYHWEIWSKGDRILKKSRYIPKRLLAKVEKMEAEKAPVREILELLKNRSKRKKL